MRDGCGKRIFFNEEKRQGEFNLPEALAGAGPYRDLSWIRKGSAGQIVVLYDGGADTACPRHGRATESVGRMPKRSPLQPNTRHFIRRTAQGLAMVPR